MTVSPSSMNDNKRRLQDNTATPASRETSKVRPSTKRPPSISSSCSASKSSSSASLQKTWLSTRPQHNTIDQTSRIRSTLLFLDPNVPETVPADAKTINQFFEKAPEICTAIDSNSPVSSDLCPLSDCISLYKSLYVCFSVKRTRCTSICKNSGEDLIILLLLRRRHVRINQFWDTNHYNRGLQWLDHQFTTAVAISLLSVCVSQLSLLCLSVCCSCSSVSCASSREPDAHHFWVCNNRKRVK